MNFYVVGFRIDPESHEVVLIRKNKPAWQKGKLNGVGGSIEEGEKPLDAMIREFREETGQEITDWEQTVQLLGAGFHVFFYRSFGSVTEALTTTDEQVLAVFIDDLPMFEIIPNLAWLVPMQLDKLRWPLIIPDEVSKEEDHVDSGQ